jgi:hypothetical protein
LHGKQAPAVRRSSACARRAGTSPCTASPTPGSPACGRRCRSQIDGDIEGVSVSFNHLCLALDFVGRTADSAALVGEALEWASSRTTLYTPMINMLDSIVLVLFRLGRWREAEDIADRLYAGHGAPRVLMAAVVLAELAAASPRAA